MMGRGSISGCDPAGDGGCPEHGGPNDPTDQLSPLGLRPVLAGKIPGHGAPKPLCSTFPLDWFPLRAVRNKPFLSLNDAEFCPQKRVSFKFLVLVNQFHCTFSCCCACLQHPVFEDVKSFQSGLPPAAQDQFLGIEMENRLGQPGPAIGGGVFYWIGGAVCQMRDRRNPNNSSCWIEYKNLCSILKTFRWATQGFPTFRCIFSRFILIYAKNTALSRGVFAVHFLSTHFEKCW